MADTVKIFSVEKVLQGSAIVRLSQEELGLPKVSVFQPVSSMSGLRDLAWSEWTDVAAAVEECREELKRLHPHP